MVLELKKLEKEIAGEIYDLKALLDGDALDSYIYEKSRKKLILFVSRYQREGGNDYRFILPSKTLIKGGSDYNDFNLSFTLPIVDYELRRNAYELYLTCLNEYHEKKLTFMNIAVGVFCPSVEPGVLITIVEILDGVQAVLAFDEKLNEEEANRLLEKYYLSADKKNRKIWFQKEAVELDEDLKTSPVQYNGDPFVRRLVGLNTQGLPDDVYAVASLQLIRKIIDSAVLDIEENRLSTPANNNALGKYNNILILDEHNSEAKQGLIDIASKYIDLAKLSAEKGQTAQVRIYIEKALKGHPNILSNKQQQTLLDTSKHAVAKINKRKKEEERQATAVRNEKAQKAQRDKRKDEERKDEERKARVAEFNASLQESLAEEEQERETTRVKGILSLVVLQIKQKVKRNWIRPGTGTSGLQVTLHVKLMPGGDVKQVTVVKSSGNAIFDRSAESAVYKAAPLPMPADPKAAEAMNEIQLDF